MSRSAKTPEDERAYRRRLYAENRDRIRAQKADYRRRNPDRVRKWSKTPVDPTKRRAAGRRHYWKKKEERLMSAAKWRALNPEKNRATKRKSRAKHNQPCVYVGYSPSDPDMMKVGYSGNMFVRKYPYSTANPKFRILRVVEFESISRAERVEAALKEFLSASALGPVHGKDWFRKIPDNLLDPLFDSLPNWCSSGRVLPVEPMQGDFFVDMGLDL